MQTITGVTFLSTAVILLAYIYNRHANQKILTERLNSVLSGLLRAEQKVNLPDDVRVAVGFGACQDVIVDALEVLAKIRADVPKHPKHMHEINTKNDFEEVFAYFFRHGAAAERYIRNESLFLDIIQHARSLPTAQLKLGGNAAVMATRFHMEGCKVLLGSKFSTELKQQIPSAIKVAGGELTKDDIHLSMEYKKGDSWGPYTSPRANRFFFHNDANNPLISSMEEFASQLTLFKPSLLVVGGLQMMDNFPFKQGERETRLDRLQHLLRNTPRHTRIHFEMASFAEDDCLQQVVERVVRQSDSLGMNEQELPNLYSVLTNGSIKLISDANPRIATTLDQMRAVFKILQDPQQDGRSLTRLHVHTLAYQAIMTDVRSPWRYSMSAAAKSALTAHRHTCATHTVHAHNARLLMDMSFRTSGGQGGVRVPLQADRPVSCWQEGNLQICVAPVPVCTNVVQTGGGGDNISSAGLVLQI